MPGEHCNSPACFRATVSSSIGLRDDGGLCTAMKGRVSAHAEAARLLVAANREGPLRRLSGQPRLAFDMFVRTR